MIAALLALLACAAPARGDGIEPFEGWLQARTEHWVFVYEPRDEASVAELLGFAEEVYEQVTERFGTRPPRVPVIVRGRTASANGFYNALPHRIELFVTSPSGPWLGARGPGWLRLLLTHELTHYVQITSRDGVFGGLSRVFGHDATALSVPLMPGWFIEGMTTHNETVLTSGGRGRNPFFEMLYKAPVLEGRFWEMKKAAYGSSFAPRERIYVSGWLLTDALSRRFGADVYRRIHRAFARSPLLGVDRAVKRVTGLSAARIWADVKAELEARFAADAALPQGRLLSPARPGDWYPPRVSRAGWFAYSRSHDATPGVYRLDGRQWPGELVLAGLLTDESSFDVSADGRSLVAARPVPDPGDPAGFSAFSDLWLVDLQAGSSRRLTTGLRVWHPALSPDGKRIVAVERAGSYSRLVEVQAESGGVRVLYEPRRATVYGPRFDERGERVVFVENARGTQDVMLLEGGSAQPLFGRDAPGDYYPAFSGPDTVLFSSDRQGSLALYEYDLRARTLSLVVRDRVAAWSGIRTAQGLLYGSYSSDGYCVRLAPASPPVEVAGLASVEPAPPSAVAAVSGSPYRDVALPLVWFPYVGLSGSLETGLDLLLGAALYGAGALQRNTWLASAAWNPYREQPDLALAWTWNPGPLSLDAEARQLFREVSDGWEQQLAASLSLGFPLWARADPGATASLSGSLSVLFESTRDGAEPFAFGEGLEKDPEREISVGASGAWALRAEAPPRAVFGRAAASAAGGVSVTPPLLDRGEAEATVTAAVRGQVPALGRFAALGLEARGVLASGGSVEDLLPPRGGAPWEPGDGGAKLLAAVEWLQPLGLFDRRAFGVSLLAAGALAWAQAGAYLEPGGPARLLDDVYFGVELDAALLAFNAAVSAGAGLAVKVDRSFAEAPAGDDLHVYFFVAPSIGGASGDPRATPRGPALVTAGPPQ